MADTRTETPPNAAADSAAGALKHAAFELHEAFVARYGSRWCGPERAAQLGLLERIEAALTAGGISAEQVSTATAAVPEMQMYATYPPEITELCTAIRGACATVAAGPVVLRLHHFLMDRYGTRWLDPRRTSEERRLEHMRRVVTEAALTEEEAERAERRICANPDHDRFPPPLEGIVDEGRRNVTDESLFRAAVGNAPFPAEANPREVAAYNRAVADIPRMELASIEVDAFVRVFARHFRSLAHAPEAPPAETPRRPFAIGVAPVE